MAASTRTLRRVRFRVGLLSLGALIPTGLVAGACWWLTAPLESLDRNLTVVSNPADRDADTPRASEVQAEAEEAPESLVWPEEPTDGDEAKEFLLAFLQQAYERLEHVRGYTATLRRQERIRGELSPEQRLKIKVRHDPFAIYLRFEAPKKGKEAIFVEGQFDEKVIAHNGGWARRLIPRLKLDPDGPIALAENRHPITEAGLKNLTEKLVRFRTLDLEDPDAGTTLDRTKDEQGRTMYRSIHTHTIRSDERPFAYVEVLYCPNLLIPIKISSYDWPEDPEAPIDFGNLPLAERYHYQDINFNVELSANDFDPTNPNYGFHRY